LCHPIWTFIPERFFLKPYTLAPAIIQRLLHCTLTLRHRLIHKIPAYA
jgi:hypothetical protein